MNAITKSGNNGFHGDVFYFLRHDKMDAANFFTPTKSELRRHQFGFTAGGPFRKDKLFWFTDYQGTRQVQGAETGIVNLPPAAQFQGDFGTGVLTGTVDGGPGDAANCPASVEPCVDWPTRLSQRLGYAVTADEPYWTAGCNTLQDGQNGMCVFPGGVIPQKAWSPAAIGTIKYIPQPNIDPVAGTYSDNSQKSTVTDNKIGERVDFNNHKTGNWSFYYHFDDSTVFSVLPSDGSKRARFSCADANSGARVCHK